MRKKTTTQVGRADQQPERTHRNGIDPVVFILALLGVLVAGHLLIQEGRHFDRGCTGFLLPESIEAAFDCEVVVSSQAGHLLGVSNAAWGLLFYLVIGSLTAAASLARVAMVPRIRLVRMLFVSFGFLYTMYLVYYQRFVLHEFCALCLTSATVVSLLFLLHLYDRFSYKLRRPFTMHSFKITREVRLYSVLAVLTLLLVGTDVVYFSRLEAKMTPPANNDDCEGQGEDCYAPDLQPITSNCYFSPDRQPIDNYMDLVGMGDPVKGNPEAKVTVIEIFEPNCGHCRALVPIMNALARQYEEQAQFYMLPVLFYPQPSYLQVAALYAAQDASKYFEMLEVQFERQQRGGLSLEQLSTLAREIGMDSNTMTEKIKSDTYRERILSQRSLIVEELGIRSVPTVMINGRIVATRTQECLAQLIQQAIAQP